MTGSIRSKLDTFLLAFLVIINSINLFRRGCHIFVIEKLLIRRDISHTHKILSDVFVDRLSWMGHEHFALKASFLGEVRKTRTMVHVEMC